VGSPPAAAQRRWRANKETTTSVRTGLLITILTLIIALVVPGTVAA
jgi:hypothetical protein